MVEIIDSFEDGDINEYSNHTSAFSAVNAEAQDGSYSLESSSGGNIRRHDITIESGADTQFGFYTKPYRYDGGFATYEHYIGLLFGLQNTSELNGYYLYLTTNEIILREYDGGGSAVVGDQSLSLTGGNYYEVVVETWDSGDIQVSVYDTSGTQIGSTINVTSSTYSSGGIGWQSNVVSDGSKNPHVDGFYGPDKPAAPTNLTASTQ